MFKIYKGDDVVVEGESPLTITGLDPDTEITEGTYQVVRVDDDNESDRVDIPAFKTLPIEVDSVELTPNTNNLEVDETRQLNVDISPSNATNQSASYESSNEGVATVNNDGLVTAVAEGEATITVTVDGKTDTATVNVTEPEPEPEPED